MPDNKNKLPKFDDWLAPWERDSEGNALAESEAIDPAKVKKLVYGLHADKARLSGELATITTDRDAKATALSAELRKSETADQTAAREQADLKAKVEKYEGSTAREVMKLRAAMSAGLTDVNDALRLVGDTEEALTEDAKSLAKRFGVATTGTENGNGEQEQPPPRQRPTGGKPNGLGGHTELNTEREKGIEMARRRGFGVPDVAKTG
ncbi:MAG: hypothetical protein M3Q75_16000 [Gemmatimonadota bacterium]|nr:hypothetical protein [Gemmatimonadota bacterium]